MIKFNYGLFSNIGDNNFCAFRFGRKYKLHQPE